LTNVALIVLGFFVTRGYLSSDQLGMLISGAGVLVTLAVNGFHHSAAVAAAKSLAINGVMTQHAIALQAHTEALNALTELTNAQPTFGARVAKTELIQ